MKKGNVVPKRTSLAEHLCWQQRVSIEEQHSMKYALLHRSLSKALELGFVQELAISKSPHPLNHQESTRNKEILMHMLSHPAKNILGYNTVTLRSTDKSPPADQLYDNMQKLLKDKELSPFGLYPTAKSMGNINYTKRKIEPIRTSIRTYNGKTEMRIYIISIYERVY